MSRGYVLVFPLTYWQGIFRIKEINLEVNVCKKNILCLSTLGLLIILGLSNCFLFKQKYSERLFIEGNIGSGPGELSWKTIDYLPTGPTSFGINNRQEIFVLDFLNKRVVKYDKNGNYVESFSQDAKNPLMDITFDKNDNIYIEYTSGNIGIYDTDMILKRILDLKRLVPPITPKITPLEVTDRNTILLVNPKINKENEIIEVDTTGNIIEVRDKRRGYIVTKGEYYMQETTEADFCVYNKEDRRILSIRKLKLKDGIPEIIGIDSSGNLYLKVGVKGLMQDRIIKVSPRGRIMADFVIKYSSGHTDVCRTARVSGDGKVYILDDLGEKFQLWEYSP
ncbi:hypothetical protein JW879_05690 [candidate division WOR-3 bacterium]|nr:hypothetical protein [candidate division WOR-3 bacterium]